MGEVLKTLLEALKLAPRYLIAIGAGAALLLFLDPAHLKTLGLDGFVTKNKMWLGLALTASVALLLVEAGRFLWACVGGVFTNFLAKRTIETGLQNLTESEKQILRYYYAKQTRTNSLRVNDGVVIGLAQQRIIYQAASVGTLHGGFAFNIHPHAWKRINENPDLLAGETRTYRTDKDDDW